MADKDAVRALASSGEPPPLPWLRAFVEGSQSSAAVAAGECGPDDITCASLPKSGLMVALGRKGRPFRARERRQLAALARIADRRVIELD